MQGTKNAHMLLLLLVMMILARMIMHQHKQRIANYGSSTRHFPIQPIESPTWFQAKHSRFCSRGSGTPCSLRCRSCHVLLVVTYMMARAHADEEEAKGESDIQARPLGVGVVTPDMAVCKGEAGGQ